MAATQTLHMCEQEYREFALGDTTGQWELVGGQLREKPWMSVEHDHIQIDLVEQFLLQLDRGQFRVSVGQARLRVSSDTYYIPDIAVIPASMERALRETLRALNAYPDPLPLVVEVWSPSTGNYDIDIKIPDYKRHGVLEIWRILPYEQTLTSWVRQSDGSYTETVYRGGGVALAAVPGIVIDIDALFVS